MSVHIDQRFLKQLEKRGNASTSVTRTEYLEVLPIGGVANATVEFQIPASSAGWLDLSQSYIQTNFTYVSQTGIPPFQTADTPVEGFGDALWSGNDTYINGTLVSDNSPGLAPYQAFIRKTQRMPYGWATGKAEKVVSASLTADDGTPASLADLRSYTLTSDPGWGATTCGYALFGGRIPNAGINMIGNTPSEPRPRNNPGACLLGTQYGDSTSTFKATVMTIPESGVWRMPGFLPPQLDIRLQLTKSSTAFHIFSGLSNPAATSSVTFNSCKLFLKRVFPSESLNRELAMSQEDLAYDMRSSRVTQDRISAGALGADIVGVLSGYKPETVSIMFIRSAAVSGSFIESPFSTIDFIGQSVQSAMVNSIYITWGNQQIPLRPVTSNSVNDKSVAYANYLAIYEKGDADIFSRESTPMLSYAQFQTRPIFCFDLRQDAQNPSHDSRTIDLERGSLSVHATFDVALPVTTSVIICGVGRSELSIGKDGRVEKTGF